MSRLFLKPIVAHPTSQHCPRRTRPTRTWPSSPPSKNMIRIRPYKRVPINLALELRRSYHSPHLYVPSIRISPGHPYYNFASYDKHRRVSPHYSCLSPPFLSFTSCPPLPANTCHLMDDSRRLTWCAAVLSLTVHQLAEPIARSHTRRTFLGQSRPSWRLPSSYRKAYGSGACRRCQNRTSAMCMCAWAPNSIRLWSHFNTLVST